MLLCPLPRLPVDPLWTLVLIVGIAAGTQQGGAASISEWRFLEADRDAAASPISNTTSAATPTKSSSHSQSANASQRSPAHARVSSFLQAKALPLAQVREGLLNDIREIKQLLNESPAVGTPSLAPANEGIHGNPLVLKSATADISIANFTITGLSPLMTERLALPLPFAVGSLEPPASPTKSELDNFLAEEKTQDPNPSAKKSSTSKSSPSPKSSASPKSSESKKKTKPPDQCESSDTSCTTQADPNAILGAVGAVVGLTLLVCLFCCCCRGRASKLGDGDDVKPDGMDELNEVWVMQFNDPASAKG